MTLEEFVAVMEHDADLFARGCLDDGVPFWVKWDDITDGWCGYFVSPEMGECSNGLGDEWKNLCDDVCEILDDELCNHRYYAEYAVLDALKAAGWYPNGKHDCYTLDKVAS